jgi:hypothetical protein
MTRPLPRPRPSNHPKTSPGAARLELVFTSRTNYKKYSANYTNLILLASAVGVGGAGVKGLAKRPLTPGLHAIISGSPGGVRCFPERLWAMPSGERVFGLFSGSYPATPHIVPRSITAHNPLGCLPARGLSALVIAPGVERPGEPLAGSRARQSPGAELSDRGAVNTIPIIGT